MMTLTILYDNTLWDQSLTADWGFACLIETYDSRILFDTGARGSILLANMKALNVDPSRIDWIFISHGHWDHTGGLSDVLSQHPVPVVVPAPFPDVPGAAETIRTAQATRLRDHIHSTGSLDGIEQSLIIEKDGACAVVTGCSHPGVERILGCAERIARVGTLIGGLHGFRSFELLQDLKTVCPTHCTQHREAIQRLHPEKFVAGGVGQVIRISDL